jgi:arginyl-tRNA synthetase
MMEMIRADLALLGIHHDCFSSEAEMQRSGKVDAALARLAADGLIYEGTLGAPKGETPDDWEPVELTLFRATQFGDDSDRPVRRSTGQLTYFGNDLAYHADKAGRADMLIDIWGADHSGTVKRIQAAVKALTAGKVPLDVKLVQMVRLLRAGEPVKMSKRSGSFVTLADVVEEVGRDVVRFTMLTRKADAQMDFDFAKVVEASKDNPVFYVQYAHARGRSLHRRLAADGLVAPAPDLALLDDEELALVRIAVQYPRVIEAAAATHEPHRIAFYLSDLAAAFHALWNRGNDDPTRRFLMVNQMEVTAARLALADAVGQIIRNGLRLMGVEAAEEMA